MLTSKWEALAEYLEQKYTSGDEQLQKLIQSVDLEVEDATEAVDDLRQCIADMKACRSVWR